MGATPEAGMQATTATQLGHALNCVSKTQTTPGIGATHTNNLDYKKPSQQLQTLGKAVTGDSGKSSE